MRYQPAPNQTDGPCYDECKYRPASVEADLQRIRSLKSEPESDVSTAVMRTLIEAAASKLLESLENKEKHENYNINYIKDYVQAQNSSRLQAYRQQEISPNSEITRIIPAFCPPVPFPELVNVLSDKLPLVPSYFSAIDSILSKAAQKKSRSYKTMQQKLNARPLALTKLLPSPERCIVEACLVIHLGSRNKGRGSKARHEAKRTLTKRNERRRNNCRKNGPKTNDSGVSNDYARVRYELVELPCYGDVSGNT